MGFLIEGKPFHCPLEVVGRSAENGLVTSNHVSPVLSSAFHLDRLSRTLQSRSTLDIRSAAALGYIATTFNPGGAANRGRQKNSLVKVPNMTIHRGCCCSSSFAISRHASSSAWTIRSLSSDAGIADLLMSHSVPAALCASRHHECLSRHRLKVILSLLGIICASLVIVGSRRG